MITQKQVTFLLLIGLVTNCYSQSLEFVELGYEPAQCRTSAEQTGNGLVYAAATGGTPPLSYLWQNADSSETVSHNIWGGLNIGWYTITVTDDDGNKLIDSVYLDSINPVASFEILNDGFTNIDGIYHGFIDKPIVFENTSPNMVIWPFPPGPPKLWGWKIDCKEWKDSLTIYEANTDTGYFDFPGKYEVCLRRSNKNGCADTSCKTIQMHYSDDHLWKDELVTIVSDPFEQKITVHNLGNKAYILRIFNVNGQLIEEIELNCPQIERNFNTAVNIYLFHILDPETNEVLSTGKFGF